MSSLTSATTRYKNLTVFLMMNYIIDVFLGDNRWKCIKCIILILMIKTWCNISLRFWVNVLLGIFLACCWWRQRQTCLLSVSATLSIRVYWTISSTLTTHWSHIELSFGKLCCAETFSTSLNKIILYGQKRHVK